MSTKRSWVIACCAVALSCGSDDLEPFSLEFAVIADGRSVSCTDDLSGFGPSGAYHLGINDVRFYVSNLQFLDEGGSPVEATLDENEFQFISADGTVSLIDLTSNSAGTCESSSVAFGEGTGRVHAAITGKTRVGRVASVSFDVGVPQLLMKNTIATNTPEGAPSPLNEMYWSWNSGYRHLVLNFAVRDGSGAEGGGYVHVGSRDCGPRDGKALEDRDRCTFVNTPTVVLGDFDLAADKVGLDLRTLLGGVDFVSPIYDPETFEVIGQGPGVECHSAPTQGDCAPVFSTLGIDMASGQASAAADVAFIRVP